MNNQNSNENPVFNDESLEVAKNIQPNKIGLSEMYHNLRKDQFANQLQEFICSDNESDGVEI